jgi:hypothetical protein
VSERETETDEQLRMFCLYRIKVYCEYDEVLASSACYEGVYTYNQAARILASDVIYRAVLVSEDDAP